MAFGDVSGKARKALFLDRDGIVNIDHGHVHRIDQFDFRDGIFSLVQAARRRGRAVVIVTNQAGIGRGYYSEADFQDLTRWMLDRFTEHDAPVDRVYHCPDHPEFGLGAYKRESEFRKPAPGMILLAARELGLDLPRSVLVGDRESDIEAGLRAGVGTCILVAGSAEIDSARGVSRAHAVVSSLGAIEPLL